MQGLLADPKKADEIAVEQSKGFKATGAQKPEIVKRLGHPLISTSAATPDGEVLIDAKDIKEHLGHGLDLILDGGYKPNDPSSVIDLSGAEPVVLRAGKGDVSDLVS